MLRPQIVLFSQELRRCHCYHGIFHAEFEVHSIDTEEALVKKAQNGDADAVVICFCSATESEADYLLSPVPHANHLPVLTCTKTLDSNFIRLAAQRGADRFLLCTMEAEKIRALVFEAIQGGGVREFLQSYCQDTVSPHVRKMIEAIIHAFPHRLHENDIAQRLGISRSWVQKLCRQAFGFTFTRLLRWLWVYQALRLMQRTTFDNLEIALQLHYSEESSLARDFRKELGYNPTEARKRLVEQSPEALLR
jgi:AraC-like DNA-binding protein